MRKWLIAAMVAATALMGLAVIGVGASAGEQDPHKAYVCKYVRGPGSTEVLQTGNNPIEVDLNALEGKGFLGLFPFEFSDAQGKSIAIGFSGNGFPVLTIEDCPGFEPPPTTTTVVPPPPPPTTTVTTPPPTPECPPSYDLGPWYGDPQINIDFEGEGTFEVRGGIQRYSGKRVFRLDLDCEETFRVNRYKVKAGHYLSIWQDGVLVVHQKPPRV